MNELGTRIESWRPVLTEPLLDEATSTVTSIVEALADPEASDTSQNSFSQGDAGIAVFEAYAAAAGFDGRALERAQVRLERAIGRLEESFAGPMLFEGFTGIAWTAEHLRRRIPELFEDDPNPDIDEILLDLLVRFPPGSAWTTNYDLVSGMVGVGVYALERLPAPIARPMLEAIVRHLEASAERHPDGAITWRTAPENVPEKRRSERAEGHYNLGVAHGVPGVIALLVRILDTDLGIEDARPLLIGALRWLRSHRLDASSVSLHPGWFVIGEGPVQGRLAWCYGDPGVAVTLLAAGRVLGDPEVENDAIAVARRAAVYPVQHSGVVDGTLCHGSAGLIHIFNRFHQATGEEVFAEAVGHWTEVTLRMRSREGGVAGFLAWDKLETGAVGWKAHAGFLMGAAGIGLALLAATTPNPPEWDRFLLLSVPDTRDRI